MDGALKPSRGWKIHFRIWKLISAPIIRRKGKYFKVFCTFWVKSKHLSLYSWCFNVMLLKEQNLFTDLLREPHFIFLTSLINHEIAKINNLGIIFVGCLIPGTVEINISSLLCSEVAIQFIIKWNLHCLYLYCLVWE